MSTTTITSVVPKITSLGLTAHLRYFRDTSDVCSAVISVFTGNENNYTSSASFDQVVAQWKFCIFQINEENEVGLINLCSEHAALIKRTDMAIKVVIFNPDLSSSEFVVSEKVSLGVFAEDDYSFIANRSKVVISSLLDNHNKLPVGTPVQSLQATTNKTTASTPALRSTSAASASAPASAKPAKPKSFFGIFGRKS